MIEKLSFVAEASHLADDSGIFGDYRSFISFHLSSRFYILVQNFARVLSESQLGA